jgi:hypothetical protein
MPFKPHHRHEAAEYLRPCSDWSGALKLETNDNFAMPAPSGMAPLVTTASSNMPVAPTCSNAEPHSRCILNVADARTLYTMPAMQPVCVFVGGARPCLGLVATVSNGVAEPEHGEYMYWRAFPLAIATASSSSSLHRARVYPAVKRPYFGIILNVMRCNRAPKQSGWWLSQGCCRLERQTAQQDVLLPATSN